MKPAGFLISLTLSVCAVPAWAQQNSPDTPAPAPAAPADSVPAEPGHPAPDPAAAPPPTPRGAGEPAPFPAGAPPPAGTAGATETSEAKGTAPSAADHPATFQQRYDHRGALGLLLGTTFERKDSAVPGGNSQSGWGWGLELGGTYPLSQSGNEIKLSGRVLLGASKPDWATMIGFRGYFDLSFWRVGLEQWKTFFDLDVAIHWAPRVTAGPRMGFGVQLDFLPVSGAYLEVAGQIGFGEGIRWGAELLFGFQLRSYLLEG